MEAAFIMTEKCTFFIDTNAQMFRNWLERETLNASNESCQVGKDKIALDKARRGIAYGGYYRMEMGGSRYYPLKNPEEGMTEGIMLLDSIISFMIMPLAEHRIEVEAENCISGENGVEVYFLSLLSKIAERWPEAKSGIQSLILNRGVELGIITPQDIEAKLQDTADKSYSVKQANGGGGLDNSFLLPIGTPNGGTINLLIDKETGRATNKGGTTFPGPEGDEVIKIAALRLNSQKSEDILTLPAPGADDKKRAKGASRMENRPDWGNTTEAVKRIDAKRAKGTCKDIACQLENLTEDRYDNAKKRMGEIGD
jgi:hypothetical protein